MKKLLLSLSLVLAISSTNAQNLTSENFNVFPATWTKTNQSVPVGAGAWSQGGGTAFTPGGQAGGATSFGLVNYTSVTGDNTISNWLITPSINLQNGDVISFYSRTGGTVVQFADNLELRLSTNGDFTVNPSTGNEDLGDFTTLGLAINPDLDLTSYPLTWTQFSYTVSGLSSETSCKIAFRYYVTNGGPTGANSNIIGIDTFSVDRPLATDTFFANNFAVYPNPVTSVLNINSKNNTTFNFVQVSDLNGRVIKTVNTKDLATTQINIADLTAGVYFLKVTSDQGVGTTKIVKN